MADEGEQVRFSVQPGAGHGDSQAYSDGYGVYDGVDHAWCTPALLTKAAAVGLAAELNAQEALAVAAGGRIDAVRIVPPTPVRRAVWEPAGTVDVLLYDPQSNPPQWIARVRDPDNQLHWVPRTELRPAPTD
ncbi:MAG TPA: hypothetical protein VGL05_30285 [Kribbella sp.]